MQDIAGYNMKCYAQAKEPYIATVEGCELHKRFRILQLSASTDQTLSRENSWHLLRKFRFLKIWGEDKSIRTVESENESIRVLSCQTSTSCLNVAKYNLGEVWLKLMLVSSLWGQLTCLLASCVRTCSLLRVLFVLVACFRKYWPTYIKWRTSHKKSIKHTP